MLGIDRLAQCCNDFRACLKDHGESVQAIRGEFEALPLRTIKANVLGLTGRTRIPLCILSHSLYALSGKRGLLKAVFSQLHECADYICVILMSDTSELAKMIMRCSAEQAHYMTWDVLRRELPDDRWSIHTEAQVSTMFDVKALRDADANAILDLGRYWFGNGAFDHDGRLLQTIEKELRCDRISSSDIVALLQAKR